MHDAVISSAELGEISTIATSARARLASIARAAEERIGPLAPPFNPYVFVDGQVDAPALIEPREVRIANELHHEYYHTVAALVHGAAKTLAVIEFEATRYKEKVEWTDLSKRLKYISSELNDIRPMSISAAGFRECFSRYDELASATIAVLRRVGRLLLRIAMARELSEPDPRPVMWNIAALILFLSFLQLYVSAPFDRLPHAWIAGPAMHLFAAFYAVWVFWIFIRIRYRSVILKLKLRFGSSGS